MGPSHVHMYTRALVLTGCMNFNGSFGHSQYLNANSFEVESSIVHSEAFLGPVQCSTGSSYCLSGVADGCVLLNE